MAARRRTRSAPSGRPTAAKTAKKSAAAKKAAAAKRAAREAAKRAAETRAARAVARLESLSRPRTAAQREAYESRREAAARALSAAGRSPTSIRSTLGWITRRRTERESSARAQRAAITRAQNQFAELNPPRTAAQRVVFEERKQAYVRALTTAGESPASIRASLGWISRRRRDTFRRVARKRARILGAELHGRNRDDWYTLRLHLDRETQAFQEYVQYALENQMDYDTAVDSWFSPEAID